MTAIGLVFSFRQAHMRIRMHNQFFCRVGLIVTAVVAMDGCSGPSNPSSFDRQIEDTRSAVEEPSRTEQPGQDHPGINAPEAALPAADGAAEDNPAIVDPPALLSDEELAGGWISLFDGHTLFGWSPVGSADWHVEDGAIVVTQGDAGLLCTTTQLANYVLRVDFRCEPETNSGIFLRTVTEPQDPSNDCYELNIAGADNPFPTGSLVGRKKVEGDHNTTDWQSYEVTVDGDRISVTLDGQQVMEYTDPQPIPRGLIGLQHNKGKIEFRDVRIRPLGLQNIFNGKDLSSWKVREGMKSEFTVTSEGYLNVKDGRGQIETEGEYGNFLLQLECIANGRQLNSGVFFRCIPGDVMMGYESQIHNGFRDGDRSLPVDCGTGGIFRRQDARRVVADDFVWFHKTLVADGAHIAVWVNGYQVSDWTDVRPAHENPRKGLRLEPGTIMIQGHDPTTDLSFRNLRIGSL